MLIVLSPAKKLDMSEANADLPVTEPMFPSQTQELARVAGQLDVAALMKLMKISESLGKLNADRFRDFGTMERKAAALAFAGDTYTGLEAGSLETEEMAWAQDHLRILSGLYGLLRPMDQIEPYRLEMGSRLATDRGKTLYDFWGDQLSKALNAQGAEIGSDVLVNCASQEYFGAVDLDALQLRVITPVFMEDKPEGPKVVSFYAKQARGAMARFIIQRRLTDPDGITGFDTGGYAYNPALSTADKPVFIRPQTAA